MTGISAGVLNLMRDGKNDLKKNLKNTLKRSGKIKTDVIKKFNNFNFLLTDHEKNYEAQVYLMPKHL